MYKKDLTTTGEGVAALSDDDLWSLAQEYGSNAKDWLRKFAGLLPEVFRRCLYRRHGFVSIYQYAKMVAGMNEATVSKVLHLAKRLEDKPKLRELFESGKEGWSKLRTVSFIATPKNDADLAEKVQTLPKKSLELYVIETRGQIVPGDDSQSKPPIRQDPRPYLSFPVSQNLEHKLRVYKLQLEKLHKQVLSWGEVIQALFNGRQLQQRHIIEYVCPKCAGEKGGAASGRSIAEDLKRLIIKRYGMRCGFGQCNRPWAQLHHRKSFAKYKRHDLEDIIPVCKEHHDIIHTGLLENPQDPPGDWRMREKASPSEIDKKVMRYKWRHRKVR